MQSNLIPIKVTSFDMTLGVMLDGNLYDLNLIFNEKLNRWYLTVTKDNEVVLLNKQLMANDTDILGSVKPYSNSPKGWLMLTGLSSTLPVDSETLGTIYNLYYVA